MEFSLLFAALSVAIFNARPADTCVSSGVCSGGGCQSPIPCQQASCQPGYSCGHYGCARNRARSALTRKDGLIVPVSEFLNASIKESAQRNIFGIDRKQENLFGTNGATEKGDASTGGSHTKINFATFAKLTNPNYLFRQCCEDRKLPDACLPKCHFNTFTKEALQKMFFKNDDCPIEAAADMQYCAAQGRNHVACCTRSDVQTTIAGEKCLTFCDQRANRVTRLDYTFIPCYDRFESIKRCFYDEMKTRMETQLQPLLTR